MQLQVTVEIIAVEFRPITSFEWAVMNVLSEFRDAPPTLVDTAQRLCIHEPAFLAAALSNLIDVKAVRHRRDDGCIPDLPDCYLTENGQEILAQGGWPKGNELSLQEELCIEWPSGKLCSNTRASKRSTPSTVSPQQVEQALTNEMIESALNASSNPTQYRVRSFYVSAVE